MLGSTLMPGPIVVAMVIDLMYLPLADDGLARRISSSTARVVLDDAPRRERRLADADVRDAELVGAILDLTGLELLDDAADVLGDGAELRVRHQTARTEDLTELADLAHLVGRGDGRVEVQEAALDLLDEVVAADDVGAGGLGLAGLVALGEDGDAHVLAGAVGQRNRAANLLLGLTSVDAEAEVDLDGLVELGGGRSPRRGERPRAECRGGPSRSWTRTRGSAFRAWAWCPSFRGQRASPALPHQRGTVAAA